MSIKINRLEEGHNSYPLVCRRPAETVSLQRRQICCRWGTPAYWSLVPRSSMFCETHYSRSGINHMWILKNSTDLLHNLQSRSSSQVSSIITFDFSTLYTILRMTNWKPDVMMNMMEQWMNRWMNETTSITSMLFLIEKLLWWHFEKKITFLLGFSIDEIDYYMLYKYII
jgi:hypothetical protein